MTNTLKKTNQATTVLNKLKELKIFKILDENTQNILFIGDAAILEYLKTELKQRKPQAAFNPIEFDSDNPELCWQKLDKNNEYISQSIQTIVIASLKHEQDIYQGVKSKFDHKILRLFDDIFINLVTQRDIFAPIPQDLPEPKNSYCILSTPRSGSTMFCDALASTGLAGFPKEHLREPSIALEQHGNFDSERYIRAIKSLHTSPNSVFGTKLISHFIERYIFLTEGKLNPLDYFDNFIYLVRQDKVAQAVSLFMAQKSGVWKISKAEKLSEYRDKVDNKDITNDDLQQVHRLHDRLLKEEKYLEQLCDRHNIQPLVVNYEDLTADLHGNIAKVLRYLNIISESGTSSFDISLREKKLASQKSQELIKLYRQKFG